MSIGKRVVEIVLKATDDTTGAFSGLTKKIAALSKEFPALGVLAGLGFGKIIEWAGKAAQAIQQAVAANIQLGASMDDMSQRTELSVETLMRWKYVAEQGGAQVYDFEAALRKLRKTMADAMSGNKEAVDLFARLGVEFKTADGKLRDLETVMLEIGQVINKFGAQSVQGAAAQDVLGRSSGAVVAILKQETYEIKRQLAEAEAFTSNMTTAWAQNSAAMDDAMQRAKQLRENLVAGLMPDMSGLVNFWNDSLLLIFKPEDWKKVNIAQADAAVAAGKATAEAYVGGLLSGIEADAKGKSSQVTPLILEALRAGISVTEPVLDPDTMLLVDKQRTAEAIAADLQEALILARDMVGPGGMQGQGKPDDESPVIPDYILPKPEQMQPFIGLTDEAAEALVALKKEALDAAMAYQDLAGEGDQAMQALAAMREVIDTLPPGLDPEVLQQIIDYYRELRDEVVELTDTQDALRSMAFDVANGLGAVGSEAMQAWLDGTAGAMKFASAVGNVVKKAIADLIAQLLIVGPLMKLFGSFGIPGLAQGGTIPRAAAGYSVPDGPRGMDSRLIMAMPGEEVINRNLSRRLDRMISAYEFGAAVSPFAMGNGSRGGGNVIQFNVGRPVSVLDGLAYGEAAVVASRKYQEANL